MTVQALTAEWKNEAASTRKMLAQVPTDKLEWRPHEKSMTLGFLAMHLGFATAVFADAVFEHEVYQWQGAKQDEPTSTEDILAKWDEGNALLLEKLANAKDADLAVTWTFGPKENPFMVMPRGAAARTFLFSHLIHHRGQLSVYLRLLDVKVPGMYGPSADEKMN
jgi:uncharacterized damage-inducible protein DinB